MSNENSQQPSTAIATVADDDASRAIAAFDGKQRAMRYSFNDKTAKGKADIIKSLGTPPLNGTQCVGKKLAVVDWLVHFSNGLADDTGEIRSGLRLVLHFADGSWMHTFSGSLIDGWATTVRLFGGDRDAWPITIELESKRSSRGPGSYLQISSVSPASGAVVKPDRKGKA